MILRLEVQKTGETCAYIYQNGEELSTIKADSMREVARKLDGWLKEDWHQIKGIYVFEGPGGFSRLRATHAFALGLATGLGVCAQGYEKWDGVLAKEIPVNNIINTKYNK